MYTSSHHTPQVYIYTKRFSPANKNPRSKPKPIQPSHLPLSLHPKISHLNLRGSDPSYVANRPTAARRVIRGIMCGRQMANVVALGGAGLLRRRQVGEVVPVRRLRVRANPTRMPHQKRIDGRHGCANLGEPDHQSGVPGRTTTKRGAGLTTARFSSTTVAMPSSHVTHDSSYETAQPVE